MYAEESPMGVTYAHIGATWFPPLPQPDGSYGALFGLDGKEFAFPSYRRALMMPRGGGKFRGVFPVSEEDWGIVGKYAVFAENGELLFEHEDRRRDIRKGDAGCSLDLSFS